VANPSLRQRLWAMSVDVMEEHAPHKKSNIPSRTYDDDLDGFNELERMDSAPMETHVGNQMHNGSMDNNIYASTSMHQQPPSQQPPQSIAVSSSHPQQQQQQQHSMHTYQTTSGPSSSQQQQQPSVLTELLMSNPTNSMSSPRQPQYGNQFQNRPIGRSPMTVPNGGTNMMSPPTMPQRPMNPSQLQQQQQQMRQQVPGNPQMQGGQMYDQNYPMQNQPQQGYLYQGQQQMVQRPMGQQYVRQQVPPQQMIRGNAVRKETIPPNMRGKPQKSFSLF
jgi:hypothetical protein